MTPSTSAAPSLADQRAESLAFAEAHPATYRRNLMFMAWLGSSYLRIAMFSLYVLSVFNAIWITLALLYYFTFGIGGYIYFHTYMIIGILVAYVWAVGGPWSSAAGISKAMRVPFELPEGIKLTRQMAPQLFALIDELQSKLKTPRLDHVILTGDLNAAVGQLPPRSLIGRYEHFLLLGLPLMDGLTGPQFKGVLAHEFGHLAGRHGRDSRLAYSVRSTWARLEEHLGDTMDTLGFSKFIEWYGPKIDALSFPLARTHEIQADKSAAEITGPKPLAEALVLLRSRLAHYGENFWTDLNRTAVAQAVPPPSPYTIYRKHLSDTESATESNAALRKRLSRALAADTDFNDTHPCLRERLTLLGEWPQSNYAEEVAIPDPTQETATVAYFGTAESSIRRSLDDLWIRQHKAAWQDRYERAQKVDARLTELATIAETQTLPRDVAWERAALTAEFRETAEALPLIEEIIATQPWRISAQIIAARLLLADEDPRGIEITDGLLPEHPRQYLQSIGNVLGYHAERGETHELQVARDFAQSLSKLVIPAAKERNKVTVDSRLMDPQAPAILKEEIQAWVNSAAMISGAFLVRADVKKLPTVPAYLLVLDYPDPASIAENQREQYANLINSTVRMISGDLNDNWWVLIAVPHGKSRDAELSRVARINGVVQFLPNRQK